MEDNGIMCVAEQWWVANYSNYKFCTKKVIPKSQAPPPTPNTSTIMTKILFRNSRI
jgi:hypothetical protein